jgi:hypothetical protein
MANRHDNGVTAIKLLLVLPEDLLVLPVVGTADIGWRYVNSSKVRDM